MLITSPIYYEKEEFNSKKLTNYAEHVNTSTAT